MDVFISISRHYKKSLPVGWSEIVQVDKVHGVVYPGPRVFKNLWSLLIVTARMRQLFDVSVDVWIPHTETEKGVKISRVSDWPPFPSHCT